MAAGKQVAIIGAALDLGPGRRGVDMGPSAIRYAGLEERLPRSATTSSTGATSRLPCRGDSRTTTSARATCRRSRPRAAASRRSSRLALARGLAARSCSAATTRSRSGTLGGLARRRGAAGGVIWIDAHGDLNTPETSPTGNVHGMPLAAALGLADELVRARAADAARGRPEPRRARRPPVARPARAERICASSASALTR